MKRLAWMLAAILVAVTTAACGSSSSGDSCNTASPLYNQIQGGWSMCTPVDPTGGTNFTASQKTTLTVNGCSVTAVSVSLYLTSPTCSGTATPVATGTGSVVIGSSQTAAFNVTGMPSVTAYQLDVTYNVIPAGSSSVSTSTIYTLGYVTPDVLKLYMGQQTSTLDGSTPAKRPTTLEGQAWFNKL